MAIVLKKSLSHTLTRYYPFAGRFPSFSSPYVDCNDDGVLFLEARSDTQLDSFQRRISCQEDAIDQLFPDDMINYKNTTSTDLVAVQLTHFACGGSTLAVSFSHAIGDARTLSSFLKYWASVARYGSTDHVEVLPLNPHFIQSPLTEPLKTGPVPKEQINVVLKKFVFPNSRLSELKKKIAAGSVTNPTRFEVLTSLLYKTMVAASTARSGCFKPSYLIFMGNVPDKVVPKLPQSTVGNLVKVMMTKTMHESETSLSLVTAEIRKEKQLLYGIKTIQDSIKSTKSVIGKLRNGKFENIHMGKYHVSSVNRQRYKEIQEANDLKILLVKYADWLLFSDVIVEIPVRKEEMELWKGSKYRKRKLCTLRVAWDALMENKKGWSLFSRLSHIEVYTKRTMPHSIPVPLHFRFSVRSGFS
ncbi:hypothetical protein E3N88_09407 [Mikania micrantha]|uniref:Uncharacterized protein n=1 Tax=Mikania micrantha TaxID=192012 RepID=A0A5N6PKX6_9ASTR|nr:hypothetical protein E3N88_09407 [Mikania micrantha]